MQPQPHDVNRQGHPHPGAATLKKLTGRFLSLDPLLTTNDPQSLNGYTYADNNPVTLSDPDGTCVIDMGGCYRPNDPKQHNCEGVLTDAPCGTPGASAPGATVPIDSSGPYQLGDSNMHMPYGSNQKNLSETFWDRFYTELAKKTQWWNKDGGGPLGEPLPLVQVAAAAMYACDHTKYCSRDQFNYAWDMCSKYNYEEGAPGLYDGRMGGGGDADELAGLRNNALGKPSRMSASACDSFAPNTEVLLGNGNSKAIKDLMPGDEVAAADPVTGKYEGTRAITASRVHHDHDLVDLDIEITPGHVVVLHTTAHHPFWDDTSHRWVTAGELPLDTEPFQCGHCRVTSVPRVGVRNGQGPRAVE
jgi:hypothetical protein